MSITIEFTPWRTFRAHKKSREVRRWLQSMADASEEAFKHMSSYPPASSPGEYPARRTSNLYNSIRTVVTSDSFTIGSNMPYSIFLRRGTSRMQRRNMSDTALQEGMHQGRLGRWVEWTRG
jgi:hypothetical protein